eukprot:TRINITY_DN971_c2_g1_i1.p1 TRINITY_DN971_c2_g1~~TRINITY_DN971_c2_g1_i1.p1  ORF type:complete len:174 (-),score=93.09 TRINITY_DN971_c2_g1_i1:139-582(-)
MSISTLNRPSSPGSAPQLNNKPSTATLLAQFSRSGAWTTDISLKLPRRLPVDGIPPMQVKNNSHRGKDFLIVTGEPCFKEGYLWMAAPLSPQLASKPEIVNKSVEYMIRRMSEWLTGANAVRVNANFFNRPLNKNGDILIVFVVAYA